MCAIALYSSICEVHVLKARHPRLKPHSCQIDFFPPCKWIGKRSALGLATWGGSRPRRYPAKTDCGHGFVFLIHNRKVADGTPAMLHIMKYLDFYNRRNQSKDGAQQNLLGRISRLRAHITWILCNQVEKQKCSIIENCTGKGFDWNQWLSIFCCSFTPIQFL